jgi:hypothetical protein
MQEQRAFEERRAMEEMMARDGSSIARDGRSGAPSKRFDLMMYNLEERRAMEEDHCSFTETRIA